MKSLLVILCVATSALGWRIEPVHEMSKLEPVPRLYDNRIVGGTIAGAGEFPYQVSLQKSGILGRFHFCGGSVLSTTSVLTAAHCLDGQSASQILAVAGEWDLATASGDEQELQASSLVIHQSYNSNDQTNDIGIVHLSGSFTYNSMVEATVLPAAGLESTSGASCVVTGWGTTTEGGSAPDILRKVTLNVVSDADCGSAYGTGAIVDSMICAAADGKDSCQGDSGGPLYSNGAQIGVVSWGYGCARPNFPGVYTQTSYFINWISANRKL